MAEYDDVYAKCPFFQTGEKKRIVCEGLIDKTKCVQLFATGVEREEHRRAYCDDNYEQCCVYAALARKYEEMEDGKT